MGRRQPHYQMFITNLKVNQKVTLSLITRLVPKPYCAHHLDSDQATQGQLWVTDKEIDPLM